jgi:adenylosuccinate synthase
MNRLKIDPQYKAFPGWKTNITAVKDYAALPQEMKDYIGYLNTFLGVPVRYISNGPQRDQIVVA